MNRFNNTIEFKHAGDSRLFNHYSKFFDKNVVNVTYDNKAEYSALVDTLKKLAGNDV